MMLFYRQQIYTHPNTISLEFKHYNLNTHQKFALNICCNNNILSVINCLRRTKVSSTRVSFVGHERDGWCWFSTNMGEDHFHVVPHNNTHRMENEGTNECRVEALKRQSTSDKSK